MASGTIIGGGNGEKEGSKDNQKGEDSKVYSRKSIKGSKTSNKNSNVNQQHQSHTDTVDSEDTILMQNIAYGVASGDSSSKNRPLGSLDGSGRNMTGKVGFMRHERRVTINLSTKSKSEVQELRKKLEGELEETRSLMKKIEGKEGKQAGNGGRRINNGGGLKRVHSEVGSVGTPRVTKPSNQLRISVENTQGLGDNAEKEKRTPKANKLYRNSEFLLAKDKFPPAESNKKSKSSAKKGAGAESGHGSGLGKFPTQIFKSCASLLDRLIKHKHGWVFSKPVDPVALGLNDYFDIIKNPMDLGTVKSRLNTNWYKSPKEFAEDVRLTFQNAMLYNPKGQDVHFMAEELLKIFEEKWSAIEADYMREMRNVADYEMSFPAPASKRAPPALLPHLEVKRPLGRSESITHVAGPKTKAMTSAHPGRTAAPRKPKAKDPNKREMTYEEKQKLSSNLQNIPSEKLESVVQIIRKRNPSLCQNDDEIEVDIDNVDTETLWELDRFVTNFKKNLNKNKRNAELGIQAKGATLQDVQEKVSCLTSISFSPPLVLLLT